EHTVCEYRGQPAEPAAYAPGCPGAARQQTGSESAIGIHGSSPTRVASIVVGSTGPGSLAVGQSVAIAGRGMRIGALNVWLTFS
ncbi:MAG TPA: hypothetical protein VG602_09210, partial [Actinomycetota bacterium]|nr:hypothetical protein [Actinomycetota bacterium]